MDSQRMQQMQQPGQSHPGGDKAQLGASGPQGIMPRQPIQQQMQQPGQQNIYNPGMQRPQAPMNYGGSPQQQMPGMRQAGGGDMGGRRK